MPDSIQTQVARNVSTFFNYDSPIPYEIDVAGGVTYKRWSANDTDAIFIARTTVVGGNTKNDFTIDLWANRATADYVYNR
jgi:hypothetical protein